MTPRLKPSTTGSAPKLGSFAKHSHPFVRVIWEEIIARKVSVHSVAKAAGLDPSSLYKWRKSSKGPTLGQVDDILSVLGYELIVRKKD
jgi:DNA-binding phage protein